MRSSDTKGMDLPLSAFLPLDRIEALLVMPFGEIWLAAAIMGLTASFYASGIPGALLPISFSSGALLGGAFGIASVATGALAGSLILYALLERGSHTALRDKYEDRLARLEELASRGGILPIIGLRLVGAPHVVVTALCALTSVGPRRYAVATLAGLLPAIALSATAGAAL